MSSAEPPDAGFTLIEMLVSLAVLSLAVVLGAQTLSIGQRSIVYTRSAAARADDVAAAQDLLRARFERLFADADFDSSGTVSVDVLGFPNALEFTADLTDPQPALRRFRLALSSAGDLTLASGAAQAGATFSTPHAILSGVRALSIDYLPQRSAAPAATPEWVSTWKAQKGPPALIRIRLAFADDRRVWPELIVRPHVTVDDACSVDPATGGCRGRA